MKPLINAVLWDFGGVITSSPFEAFNKFESENNIPLDFIRLVNAENHERNAWAQLESSEVTLDEFDVLFRQETKLKGYEISGKEVIDLLSGDIRPSMVKALQKIAEKYAVGCITNNVNSGQGPGMAKTEKKANQIQEVMSSFGTIIESSKVGMRKPDPRIYQLACEKMRVSPKECIYLDDLGINLKPARALGMITIKVISAEQAISELEHHLSIRLA
ncbi:MAG: HAD family hydrolase [Gammaproteobacteria bacterium]|nr:HAD family hydrolase [Gammaproteobacteria bacterium]